MIYESFLQMFMGCTESHKDRPLFVTSAGTFFYSDFRDGVLRLTAAFRQIESDMIILSVQDQLCFAECFFAAVFSGHKVCITAPESGVQKRLHDGYLIKDDHPYLQYAGPLADTDGIRTVNSLAPCVIAFSSGTTGFADGVVLSQRNILKNVQSILQYYCYNAGEKLLHILPFHHMFGLVSDLFMVMECGAQVYLPDSYLQIPAVLRTFLPETVNLPPAMANTLCKLLASDDELYFETGKHLRRILCGGAPLSSQTSQKLLAYHILPMIGYGMTECSPCISVTPQDKVKPGTAGVPLKCWDLRITEDSEIIVRGECVMIGYLKDENETKARIRDGWLHTGDAGYIDSDGNLVVTGRLNNVLIFSNGTKCLAERAEAQINAIDGVEESMLSKTQNEYGSYPKLVIVTVEEKTKDSEHLQGRIDSVMRELNLFPYELEIRASALPRNQMGKLIRNGAQK